MSVFPSPRRRRPTGPKELIRTYDSYRRGLNTLLLDSELNPEEVRDATNLQLVGKGILEPRGGTDSFYRADSTGTVRYMADFYTNNAVQLLAITDNGFLTKKNGASYTRILGASFASGKRSEGTQVQGIQYLVDGTNPLARYDGTTLLSFTSLLRPTSLLITKSSGASGTFTWSYRISAESDVGETLASDPVTLANLPEQLTTDKFVTVNWTNASPASLVRGYAVYGRESGYETLLTRVPPNVTSWVDNGTTIDSSVFPPTTNTTGGPIAKHIMSFKGNIVLGNLNYDNSQVLFSGAGPNINRFTFTSGGGYVSIEKNSGDRYGITGLAEKEGKIIAFKGNSIYQVTISFNSSLGINEATVQKLIDGLGCISAGTVKQVENSIMFVGNVPGRGLVLAKLDYEPNLLTPTLRYQPISARIQSIINQVNTTRIQETHAVYFNKRYHWFLPLGGSAWQTIVYDLERLAFVGPWTLSNTWETHNYLDDSNQEHFLIGKSDGTVVELSDSYKDDEGVDFTWNLLTSRDDYQRPFQLKTIVDAKTKLRNVTNGIVQVKYIIQDKNGQQVTAKTAQFDPSNTFLLAGWGSRRIGYNNRFGYTPSSGNIVTTETVKYTLINKPNVLSTQIQITSSDGAKCQILSSEVRARQTSVNNVPNSWRG